MIASFEICRSLSKPEIVLGHIAETMSSSLQTKSRKYFEMKKRCRETGFGGEQRGIQSPSFLIDTKHEQWLAANSSLTATVWKSTGSPLQTVTFHCSTSSLLKLLSPLIIMLLRVIFEGANVSLPVHLSPGHGRVLVLVISE